MRKRVIRMVFGVLVGWTLAAPAFAVDARGRVERAPRAVPPSIRRDILLLESESTNPPALRLFPPTQRPAAYAPTNDARPLERPGARDTGLPTQYTLRHGIEF